MADRLRKTFADGVRNDKYLIIIVDVTRNIRHVRQFADVWDMLSQTEESLNAAPLSSPKPVKPYGSKRPIKTVSELKRWDLVSRVVEGKVFK